MSWIAIIVDPNDNKVKLDWFNLKKIVIVIVQGDQFLFIIFEFDYQYSSCCDSFFLMNFRSSSFKAFLLFYTIFPLLSLPSTCRLDCWC